MATQEDKTQHMASAGQQLTQHIVLSSIFYVQDERYTAGAGMRRSGAFQFCTVHDAGTRSSGASQFCTESRYLHGSGGRAVPYFRTRCYVQDERYIAKEHMDVRRDCVNFAQRLATCMGAKAAQYLASGRAVKHPCALILDSCLVRS